MQRVLVVGGPGSGKSTFAHRLGAVANLPVVSLDALFWQPGWQESRRDEFQIKLEGVISEPQWIIDGNYLTSTGAPQLALADTIYWLDLPVLPRMIGIFNRTRRYSGQSRPEMTPGCPERFDWSFVKYALRYSRDQRPKLVAVLKKLRPDQRLVRFTKRRETDRHLFGLAMMRFNQATLERDADLAPL
ncbi:MAG: DNA topology modulation protein [Rhabdaerophilum sp.]